MDLEKELNDILDDVLKGKITIDKDKNFANVFDSLQVLEFVSAIEKKLKIRIPDEDFFKMTNFESTLNILKGYIEKKKG